MTIKHLLCFCGLQLIQNGLITISQNKDTVAEKIWVVYQSHQAGGFTLLQQQRQEQAEERWKRSHPTCLSSRVDCVYSDCAKLSHLIWPWYIEMLQNATSGSFNQTELRPFRPGQSAGERPPVKMLQCRRKEQKRQRAVNEWRWQPNIQCGLHPTSTTLTQPFSRDTHAHVCMWNPQTGQ